MLKINDNDVYTSQLVSINSTADSPTNIPDISKIVCDGQEVWKAADWQYVKVSENRNNDSNTSFVRTSIGQTSNTFYLRDYIEPSCKKFCFRITYIGTGDVPTLNLYFKYTLKGNDVYTTDFYLDSHSYKSSTDYSKTETCYINYEGAYREAGKITVTQYKFSIGDNFPGYAYIFYDETDLVKRLKYNYTDMPFVYMRYVPNTQIFSGNESIGYISGSGTQNVDCTFRHPKIHHMRAPNSQSLKGYLFQVYVEASGGSSSGDGWVNFGGTSGSTILISNQLSADILKVDEGEVTIRFYKLTSNPYSWQVYVKSVFAPGMNET